VGWAGPAQLTGLDSAQKRGGPISAHQGFGPISTQQSLIFPSGPGLAQTAGLGQSQFGPRTHQKWARTSLPQRKEPISAGPEPAWPSIGKSTSGGNYFPPILLHAERTFCMQEENTKNQKE